MGGVWEHYGWCVGALWVVCGSIRERNYRLKKKELFIWAYTGVNDYACNHCNHYQEVWGTHSVSVIPHKVQLGRGLEVGGRLRNRED